MAPPRPPPRPTHHRVVLVGDSDISRWPPRRWPFRGGADPCEEDGDHGDTHRDSRCTTTAGGPTDHAVEDNNCQDEGPAQGRIQTPRREETAAAETDPAVGAQDQHHDHGHHRFEVVDVRGQDGATMRDALGVVRASIGEWMQGKEAGNEDGGADAVHSAVVKGPQLFVVVCASENDVGDGTVPDETVKDWSLLVEAVEEEARKAATTTERTFPSAVSVVLLGPKLEPWLAHDASSRRSYIRLSRALEARCALLHRNQPVESRPSDSQSSSTASLSKAIVRVHFVDCLTAFCTPYTANVPGALMGGRAVPDPSYFDNDQLHLSDAGYRLWRQTVEDELTRLATASDCDEAQREVATPAFYP